LGPSVKRGPRCPRTLSFPRRSPLSCPSHRGLDRRQSDENLQACPPVRCRPGA
jgi:hypothetical protein